jgi:hypothetical protein
MPAATSIPASVESTASPVKTRSRTRYKIQRSSFAEIVPKRESLSVNAEFAKYSACEYALQNPDIFHFWEVSKSVIEWCNSSLPEKVNKAEFPTLYAMAMDYLPVQATSVPCERVFSSAKETDTLKRNRISPALMEALQMLKFSLKKERLDFTAGWAVTESELKGDTGPGREALGTLLKGDKEAAFDAVLKRFLDADDEK